MANSKDLMGENRLNFFQELVPSAERTALLYHLSYLCLAKFPKLQTVLRECALETQHLFGSSEAVLQKCADTSNQMVNSLLPELKLAVRKDEQTATTTCLEKAREWITEIVNKVDEMADRYEKHSHSVASCTSDVILEKSETERKILQISKEIEDLEKVVADLQMEMRKTLDEISRVNAKIAQKNPRCHARFFGRLFSFGILAIVVPVARVIIQSIFQSKSGPVTNRALEIEKAQLNAQKSNLKNQQQNIQVRLNEVQMKLANKKTEKGSTPETVRLNDVQKYLYQIQQTLIKLHLFWKSLHVFVESLKDETFANEHIFEESELKEIFLKHIDSAQEHWKAFGESCLKAKKMFSLQPNSYKFLEINPSILSPDDWKRRYDNALVELNKTLPSICM